VKYGFITFASRSNAMSEREQKQAMRAWEKWMNPETSQTYVMRVWEVSRLLGISNQEICERLGIEYKVGAWFRGVTQGQLNSLKHNSALVA
jgi:hypothetical protein